MISIKSKNSPFKSKTAPTFSQPSDSDEINNDHICTECVVREEAHSLPKGTTIVLKIPSQYCPCDFSFFSFCLYCLFQQTNSFVLLSPLCIQLASFKCKCEWFLCVSLSILCIHDHEIYQLLNSNNMERSIPKTSGHY